MVTEAVDDAGVLAKLQDDAASGVPQSLALMSAHMQCVDSFQLAELIRGKVGAQVLMMLTTDRPADAARCRELGLRTLLKPVRRSELLEVRRAGALGPGAPARNARRRPSLARCGSCSPTTQTTTGS